MIALLLLFDLGFGLMLAAGYWAVTHRRLRELSFLDHLAGMSRAGLPLAGGLEAAAADLGGSLGRRLQAIAPLLREGMGLSDALRACPRALPRSIRATVELGDRAGNLSAFLEAARDAHLRSTEIRSRLTYVLLYPVFLTATSQAVLSFIYLFIAPKLAEVRGIPAAPASSVLAPYDLVWGAGLAMTGVVAAALILSWLGAAGFRFGLPVVVADRIGRLLALIPTLGEILRIESARMFSLGAGLLLRAGATVPEAAAAAAEILPTEAQRDRLRKAAASTAEGRPLSEACRRSGGFPAPFDWIVGSGEIAGSLPDALLQAARHFDLRSRYAVRSAARACFFLFLLLNGALILAMAGLMFFDLQQAAHMATGRL